MSTPILLAAGEWRLWEQFALRGPGFPAVGVLGLAPVGLAEAADKFGPGVVLDGPDWQGFQEVFDQAAVGTAVRLQQVAALPAFQVALAWQNPKLLKTAVSSFLAWTPSVAGRTSMPRQREELVAHYWQRFCVKNDTIGFFGPVGWGRWDRSVAGVVLEPGTGLVAASEVYFSSWSVDAVARVISADERLREYVSPRRVPFVRVVGDRVSVPGRPAVSVSPLLAAVLGCCDGVRSPAEIRASLQGEYGDVDIAAALQQLLDHRWITWRLETPADPYPERYLRDWLGRVPDVKAREHGLAQLDRLERGRDLVRMARGPAEFADAIEGLEQTFVELTEEPAARKKGEATAPCRGLVYSDSRRSATVRIGEDVLAAMAPLELLLASSRWLTSNLAERVMDRAREVYERLVAESGGSAVDLASCWFGCMPVLHGDAVTDMADLQQEFWRRWAEILQMPADAARIQLRYADIEAAAHTMFAASGYGWPAARYVSPDLMIAADDANAIARGDYTLVVGEFHAAINTIGASLFLTQHPDRTELLAETDLDHPGPRLLPLVAKENRTRLSARIRQSLVRPEDYYIGLMDYTADPSRPRTVMSADAMVSDADGRLVVTLPDGAVFDLVDVFAHSLGTMVIDLCRIMPEADHSPRVTVDKVVLAREAWRFEVSKLDFPDAKAESKRFVQARQWRTEQGLPRFVFVTSPIESRPFYVDFDSPIYVNIFAKAARRLALKDPQGKLRITEMLPGPDQVWLTDDQGQSYTSELRLIAVDQTAVARSRSAC